VNIRVIAAEGARVPRRDELGRIEPGRYVGLNAALEPEAQDVPDTSDLRRAIRRGDLVIAPSATPQEP